MAAAIVLGGPGAVFWMWVAAFFGMMTNFSENVLGIYYRRRNKGGEWSGGAMYYLVDGLGKKKGCKTGLAINPQTPVENIRHLADYVDMLLVMTVSPGFAGQKMFIGAEEKVRNARRLLDEWGFADTVIEVDGNISLENGAKLSRCGADIFVLGTSSLFLKDKAIDEAAKDFIAAVE